MNHYVKPPERGAGKNFREELNSPPDRKMTQQRSSFWASPAWSAAWGGSIRTWWAALDICPNFPLPGEASEAVPE